MRVDWLTFQFPRETLFFPAASCFTSILSFAKKKKDINECDLEMMQFPE